VQAVKFNFPNNFEVAFDSSKTTKEQLLALDVFKQYPAKVISESKAAAGSTNLAATAAANLP
jgi:predicted mannosyl-3-phosphoglycerate phosphatase (HAD superfamily)